MPVRTALVALAALLLLVAIAPQVPRSGPRDVADDGDRAAGPALAVHREGPGDGTGTLADDRGRTLAGDPVVTPGAARDAGGSEAPRDRRTRDDAGDAAGAADHASAAADHASDAADHASDAADHAPDGVGDTSDGADDASDGVGFAAEGDDLAARREQQAVYRYGVESRGEVTTGAETFTETTARILNDARGWTLGGRVAFERVADDRDLTVVLATPDEVAAAHEECGPDYSCRVEDEILINDRNWRDATPAWRRAGGDLATYRRYLINHEVGHFLGLGHVDCGGAGERAPVMQQQSVSTQECEPNGWPLEPEREELARQLDASAHE